MTRVKFRKKGVGKGHLPKNIWKFTQSCVRTSKSGLAQLSTVWNQLKPSCGAVRCSAGGPRVIHKDTAQHPEGHMQASVQSLQPSNWERLEKENSDVGCVCVCFHFSQWRPCFACWVNGDSVPNFIVLFLPEQAPLAPAGPSSPIGK